MNLSTLFSLLPSLDLVLRSSLSVMSFSAPASMTLFYHFQDDGITLIFLLVLIVAS